MKYERAEGSSSPFEPLVELIADRVATKVVAMQEREKKRLYSTEEAARYLSLSSAQVYRLTVSGKLKSLREGRRRLIDRDELDRWIEIRASRG
jgi:excisionase family DNA binding protein